MAEPLCLKDKINEPSPAGNLLQPTKQAYMCEQESQSSHTKEQSKEQSRLSKEIEALQHRLLLMQKQDENEKTVNKLWVVTVSNNILAPPPSPAFKIFFEIGFQNI